MSNIQIDETSLIKGRHRELNAPRESFGDGNTQPRFIERHSTQEQEQGIDNLTGSIGWALSALVQQGQLAISGGSYRL